jgi:hypothetical protein
MLIVFVQHLVEHLFMQVSCCLIMQHEKIYSVSARVFRFVSELVFQGFLYSTNYKIFVPFRSAFQSLIVREYASKHTLPYWKHTSLN